MSLINDALKRANQTPRKNPPPAPPLTPLQPVESARRGGGSSYLIPVLLVMVLALAGVFLVLWAKSSGRATALAVNKAAERPAVAEANPVAHVPVAPPTTAVTPAAGAKASASPQSPSGAGMVPAKYGIKISTNLVVRTNAAPKPVPAELAAVAPDAAPPVADVPPPAPETAAAPPQAVPPPKPEFPSLKLQGVFFRQSNPSVLINGRTLRTGERIEGVKVIRIERENVTLEWSGQIRTLVLDQ